MANHRAKLTGGTAITLEIATELRQVVFGSAAAPPRGEWTRTALTFGSVKEEISYGLRSPRNATRGLQTVVQAFIIKHFLFDKRPIDKKTVPVDQFLKPNEQQQNEALVIAMSDILWNVIGEKTRVIIVLPGENPHVVHSQTYFQDSITERLFIFELLSLENLQMFLKRYLYFFTEEPGAGALLLLYCAVMTRTPTKIQTDLDGPKGAHLMGPQEEGSLNIVILLLTGRSTPYLHNGVVYVGDEDHYALPQFGILSRTVIGLFICYGDTDETMCSSRQPGSRLKTPGLPIWVTCFCGHYGLLFNSNRELLRNYHAEKRFELYYYTCAGCYLPMTIDNRTQDDSNYLLAYNQTSTIAKNSSSSSSGSGGIGTGVNTNYSNEIVSTPIERLIQTKWAEAKIIFKGPIPATMTY